MIPEQVAPWFFPIFYIFIIVYYFVACYGMYKRIQLKGISFFRTVPPYFSTVHCSIVIVHCSIGPLSLAIVQTLVFGKVQKAVWTCRVLYILTWTCASELVCFSPTAAFNFDFCFDRMTPHPPL